MSEKFGYNDYVLVGSLLYSCVDLGIEWENFSSCARPIHRWLLVSFASVLALRILHIVGCRAAAASRGSPPRGESALSDFLTDLRQKGGLPRVLMTFTWTVVMPLFTIWTVLGTSWLWTVWQESPDCVPSQTHAWFSAFWLILCYAYILIHAGLGVVALTMEFRVRHAEDSLRALEDEDTLQRWGAVSHIPGGFRALADAAAPGGRAGLTPQDIKALPDEIFSPCCNSNSSGTCECSICIEDLAPGDRIRRLPKCGHTFHRSCIDLWLLRSAHCPLCKQSVKVESV